MVLAGQGQNASRAQRHAEAKSRSDANLVAARTATKDNDSLLMRVRMSEAMETHTGKVPHEWQLDVAESLLLGLDSLVIAGTGSGKTFPFMLTLFASTETIAVIISPLLALQYDQERRFNESGIPARALNHETLTKDPDVLKDVASGKYRALLVSPELLLENSRVRELFTSKAFGKKKILFFVDECHCISMWSGEFRPAYGKLCALRALVPIGSSLLATTATLPPASRNDTTESLLIDVEKAFFLNLGNDRHNIFHTVRYINGQNDKTGVDFIIPCNLGEDPSAHLTKTAIFVKDRQQSLGLCQYLRNRLPDQFTGLVDYFNGMRTPRSKARVLRQFREGVILVLITTDAFTLGTDIPDIERVVQVGVPDSLTIWVQRAGRAGRSPNINAEAILLVEKSVLQTTGSKPASSGTAVTAREGNPGNMDEPTGTDDNAGNQSDNEDADDEVTYRKKIHPGFRRYIETTDCRRDALDDEFDNPPTRKKPTGKCCDNCETKSNSSKDDTVVVQTQPDTVNEEDDELEAHLDRPITPPSLPHADDLNVSPQKSKNVNGKRTMVRRMQAREPVKHRTRVWRKNAVAALEKFRIRLKSRDEYRMCSIAAPGLLPDAILNRLASLALLQTVEDMKRELDPCWFLADDHGEEVLQVLQEVDRKDAERRQEAAAKKRKTRATKSGTREGDTDVVDTTSEVVRTSSQDSQPRQSSATSSVLPRAPLMSSSTFNSNSTNRLRMLEGQYKGNTLQCTFDLLGEPPSLEETLSYPPSPLPSQRFRFHSQKY